MKNKKHYSFNFDVLYSNLIWTRESMRMKTVLRTTLLGGIVALLSACSHADASPNPWIGTYRGELPCADCSAVVYTLNLTSDQTYTLDTLYQNTRNGDVDMKSHGQFKWDQDKTKFTLENGEHFEIGKDSITMLDNNGQEIEGPMKTMYVFKKVASVNWSWTIWL